MALQNRGRVVLFDDFLGAALAGEVAGVAENSGTAAIIVGQDGGAATITTGTSDGNRAHLSSGLNHKPANGSMYFEARVKNVTSILTRALFIGLTDTVAQENPMELGASQAITSSATDAVGFIYDTGATVDKWYTGSVKADVDTALAALEVDSVHMVPTADTYETFSIELNSDGDAVFSYGKSTGNKYGLREVRRLSDAVTASVLYSPHVGIETRTTSAATAYCDYVLVESARAD